jgi:hypothetical protein
MEYITTTQLRTKSTQLVQSLLRGFPVSLIHRSRMVGIIQPTAKSPVAITNIDAFKQALVAVKPPRLLPRKVRRQLYIEHLTEKYGPDLS